MALYVIPVPAPAAGHDWTYTVPGQYIEHITAISATLTTDTPGGTTVVDYSGNVNDGTYLPQSGPSVFVAGAFTGDDALQLQGPVSFIGGGFFTPPGTNPLTGDFTLLWWRRCPGLNTGPDIIFYDAGGTQLAQFKAGNLGFMGWQAATITDCQAGTDNFAFPQDNTWHMAAVVYHSGTGRAQIYVDGILQTLVTDIAGAAASGVVNYMYVGADIAGNYHCSGAADEFAYFDHALTASQLAALTATAPDWAAWTAAVLAQSPFTAYHLDASVVPGTSRQVDLVITDGTHTVDEVPTGFAPPSTASPYVYSWQPNLNSSTQTPTGTVTTVAIPNLILPAGYTLGTRTLDLAVHDQWGQIDIWWNSDIMDADPHLNPIDYPPGAYLVIVPQGV